MKYLIEFHLVDQWLDVSDGIHYPSYAAIGADVNLEKAKTYCKMWSEKAIAPLRIVTETPVEWESPELGSEVTDWEYATYSVWLNGHEYFPNPSPILIEVRGGVVQEVTCPEWMTYEIRDYDDNPFLDDEELDTD